MSVNITVHGNAVAYRNMFLDPETMKKQEFERKRKLRLEQVRLKSKEIASKIRKNVAHEKQKQLRRVEKTKATELLNWREKVLAEKQNEFDKNLLMMGEAHRAAEQEENAQDPTNKTPTLLYQDKIHKKQKKIDPKKQLNIKQKLENHKKPFRRKDNSELNNEQSLKADNINTLHSDTVIPEKNDHIYPKVNIKTYFENYTSSYSSLDNNILSKPSDKIYKPMPKLSKTPSVVLEIDSEEDQSSILCIEDRHEDSNRLYSKISNSDSSSTSCNMPRYSPTSKKDSNLHKEYDANRYKADTGSSDEPRRLDKLSYTEISELIQRQKVENEDSCIENKKIDEPSDHGKDNKTSREPVDTISKSFNCVKNKNPIKTTSQAPSNCINKVRFYDYPNRFAKEYVHSDSRIIRNESNINEPNANENADIERRIEEMRQKNIEELHQKNEKRSQLALEREQIRRDYEALTSKLDALSKENNFIHTDHLTINNKYMDNFKSEQQEKMNSAIQDILKCPVVITCPEVRNHPKKMTTATGKATVQNKRDINVGNSNLDLRSSEDVSALNSTDSCASILLNAVNDQKHKVSKDYGSCNNLRKKKKLGELLQRIENLKQILLRELEKCEHSTNDINIRTFVSSINNFEKERESILDDDEIDANINTRNKELKEREKRVNEKEKILEKKLRQFYEEKKQLNVVESFHKDTDPAVVVKKDVQTSKPVKIIINLNDDAKKNKTKSPFKCTPRFRSSLINITPKKRKSVQLTNSTKLPLSDEGNQIYSEAKITEQVNSETMPKSVAVQTTSESTSSTMYRSPPQTVQTKFTNILEKLSQNKEIPESLNNKPEKISSKKRPSSNPLLRKYIERLLGMSRTSIEMLGVSSSDMETPSSSVLNASANFSTNGNEALEQGKMEQLQKFINENYSFLNELQESIKSDKSSTNESSGSSKKTKEIVWKSNFEQKDDKKIRSKTDTELKPILKKNKHNNKTYRSTGYVKCNNEKEELITKYTELAENCTQRIAELTEMIDKVRDEKKKILERTLSSTSETCRNSTEYMSFAGNDTSQGVDNSSKLSEEKSLATSYVPEMAKLEKNKLTGASRDSGISLSRPLTALDNSDATDIHTKSPDHQTIYKSPDQQTANSEHDSFVPILKDIPKFSPLDSVILPQQPLTIDHQQSTSEKTKKHKPPISMSRFNPQLEELPHELSTIIEVETPGTSKLSVSKSVAAMPIVLNSSTSGEEKSEEKNHSQYKRFPTFEEYAKIHNLDLTKFENEENSSKIFTDAAELIELANKIKEMQHRQFTGSNISLEETNSIRENLEKLSESLRKISLKYKNFPDFKEYAKQNNLTIASDIISSIDDTSKILSFKVDGNQDVSEKTIKNMDSGGSGKNIPSLTSSDESLIDIVAELKERKILMHSFQNAESDESANSLPLSDIILENNVPKKVSEKSTTDHSVQAGKEILEIPTSEKIKVPPRTEQVYSLQEQREKVQFTSDGSIEGDLDKMGLKWASKMLKKSQECQAFSSSSTASSFVYTSKPKSPKKPKSPATANQPEESAGSNNSSMGKPLNLKEFLARELQKRTNASSSSIDESLASQFLRSLLSSSNSTPKSASDEKPNQDRQRTSTPVIPRSSSSRTAPSFEGSNNLFSGESRLSSVKYTSSESSKSAGEQKNTKNKTSSSI